MQITRVAVLLAGLSWAGLLGAQDVVTLKDGTTLQGQVVEETSQHVILMDNGTRRTFDRGLVQSVQFDQTGPDPQPGGDGGDPGLGNTVPMPAAPGEPLQAPVPAPGPGQEDQAAPSQDQQNYALGVSAYYSVPVEQVWGYEQQGIPYDELPVLFYVAQQAHCAPGLVVRLRAGGLGWAGICAHFGLGPGIFYWRNLDGVNLGGPYGGIYRLFHRYRRGLWGWGRIGLSDADIINSVNMRFATAYWHCRPRDVARWRLRGRPFFWRGYGQRGFYARRGVGGGERKGDWGGRDGRRGGRDGGDRNRGGGDGGWGHN